MGVKLFPIIGFRNSCSQVAILSELVGSGRASQKLLIVYYIFLSFAVLVILRGLLPHSLQSNAVGIQSNAVGTRPALVMKKRV
ncbi:Transmembrane protein 6/97 [Artemisia annua]|uniref:Transmembrane protein 6/97 n=1 Tax=Artemisia annua TaxID=35608 RepID=A0A2U1LZD1_ARTAN|nr:Transmembrane protein 6/97 [Artemisia annua]